MNTRCFYLPREIVELFTSFLSDNKKLEFRLISKYFSNPYLYELPTHISTKKFKYFLPTLFRNIKKLKVNSKSTLNESDYYELKNATWLKIIVDDSLRLHNIQKFEKLRTLETCNDYYKCDISKLCNGKLNNLKQIILSTEAVNLYENLSNFPLLQEIKTSWPLREIDVNLIKKHKNIISFGISSDMTGKSCENMNHIKKLTIYDYGARAANMLSYFANVVHFDYTGASNFNNFIDISNFNVLVNIESLSCKNVDIGGIDSCIKLKKIVLSNQKSNVCLLHLKYVKYLKIMITNINVNLSKFGIETLATIENLILNGMDKYEIDLSKLVNLQSVELNDKITVATNSLVSKKLMYIDIKKWKNTNPGSIFLSNITSFDFHNRSNFCENVITILPKLRKLVLSGVSGKQLTKHNSWLYSHTYLKELCCDHEFVSNLNCKCFANLENITIFSNTDKKTFPQIEITNFALSTIFAEKLLSINLECKIKNIRIENLPNLKNVTCFASYVCVDTTNCKNLKYVQIKHSENSTKVKHVKYMIVGNKIYTVTEKYNNLLITFGV